MKNLCGGKLEGTGCNIGERKKHSKSKWNRNCQSKYRSLMNKEI